jgi:hypothetical protein
MIFQPPINTDTIWVDVWLNPAGIEKLGAWLWLQGTPANTSADSLVLSTYLAFWQDHITAHSYNYEQATRTSVDIPASLETGGWRRITIAFHGKRHTYDLYVDAKLLKSDIGFFGNKEFGYAENLSVVRLGGGSSKESLAYYDDLYIGDASPLQ